MSEKTRSAQPAGSVGSTARQSPSRTPPSSISNSSLCSVRALRSTSVRVPAGASTRRRPSAAARRTLRAVKSFSSSEAVTTQRPPGHLLHQPTGRQRVLQSVAIRTATVWNDRKALNLKNLRTRKVGVLQCCRGRGGENVLRRLNHRPRYGPPAGRREKKDSPLPPATLQHLPLHFP